MDSNKNDSVDSHKSMMEPKKSENRLTEEQKLQLHGIAENNSATKQQILDNLKLFIDKNRIRENASPESIEKDIKMKALKSEFEAKISEATAKLLNEAKQLSNLMKKIRENMDITAAQEREQIEKLFNDAPDEIKDEIKSEKWSIYNCYDGSCWSEYLKNLD
uniref:Uncharacterized protein n=1 Tax=Panagrolaimus sp. ES5 TaxID=591445 RepID=A0AC34FS71_9BILA